MATMRVDDEVWAFLKKHAEAFEDTPNDVLRRLLLPGAHAANSHRSHPPPTNGTTVVPHRPMSFRPDQDYSYKRVTGYWLLGKHYAARSFHDVLVASAAELRKAHPNEFETKALSLHGRKRAYFARDRRDLKRAADLGGGLFVEANLSADSIVGVCRALLTALGRNPDDLRLELA
jgi:negative regulator of replication initiation